MYRHFSAITFVALASLSACSPSYNWRDVPLQPAMNASGATLMALLPCKPDRATRAIAFDGAALEVQMAGCETQGVTFTIARTEVSAPTQPADAMLQWQRSTRAQIQASAMSDLPFALRGAGSAHAPTRQHLLGRATDGSALQVDALWFVQGKSVFQAAIYAPAGVALPPDAVQSFFSGLRLP